MEPEDILQEAALQTAVQVGTDRCAKLIENSLKSCGRVILPYIHKADDPGLFVPVRVDLRDGEYPGCILTLGDRAVLAWVTRTFRVRNVEAVIPYDTIRWVEADTRAANGASRELDMLRIEAEQDWTIVFRDVFGDGVDVPALLQGVLAGWVELRRGDAEQPPSPC